MKNSILFAPDRATKDFPNGKGISAVIPSCVKTDRNHEVFKADFNFICEVCKYFDEHGNKEDKKWIENLVWDKLIPVYKNNGVDDELIEHLTAQVTECMTFKISDR